jgi:hypothetical protein
MKSPALLVTAAGRFFYATAARLLALKFILSMSVSVQDALQAASSAGFGEGGEAVELLGSAHACPHSSATSSRLQGVGTARSSDGTAIWAAMQLRKQGMRLMVTQCVACVMACRLLLMCWPWPAWKWTCQAFRRER